MVLGPRRGDHSVVHYVIIASSSIWKKTLQCQRIETANDYVQKKRSGLHTDRRSTWRCVCLPVQPSSNVEAYDEITTGLSLWVWSSRQPAACLHKHSIDQLGFFCEPQLCECTNVPVCVCVCVFVSFTVCWSYSSIHTHLEIQMAKHSTQARCKLQRQSHKWSQSPHSSRNIQARLRETRLTLWHWRPNNHSIENVYVAQCFLDNCLLL